MEYCLFAPNGESEDLILDYLGFPADGTLIKGGGMLPRNAWDWEYHKMLESGIARFGAFSMVLRECLNADAIFPAWNLPQLYILWSRYWNRSARQVANNIHQFTVGGNNDLGVISQCFTYGL